MAIRSRTAFAHYIKDLPLHLLFDLSAAVSHFLESDVIGTSPLLSRRSLRTCVRLQCVMYALNLNQGCGWWALSLWKRHDLFFPISHLVGLFRLDKRETERHQCSADDSKRTQRQRQQMEGAIIC